MPSYNRCYTEKVSTIMKTKLVSLFVALFATTALWAYDFQSGDLYYNIISESDKIVEVTYQKQYSSDNYKGLTSGTIPTSVTYNGTTYSVTSIGYRAFYGCKGLTSITIPNSVTSIGYNAFYDCKNLISVVWNAKECEDFLEKWILIDKTDNGSTYGSTNPFYGNKITSLTFGDSVATIPAYLCRYMSSLKSITIPNSVTSIRGHAFEGRRGLTSITIPNSVTSIGDSIFCDCTGLTSITIPNSVRRIGNGAFQSCYNLTSVTIGNGVASIGDNAFSGCTGLTSITIPSSVTRMGDCVFKGCTKLSSLTLLGDICTESLLYKYNNNNSKNYNIREQITSLTVGGSVTSIGESAFRSCINLTSVTIGNSVTNIGGSAFNGCSNLETIVFGDSVTIIGADAFNNCTSLTSIIIPNGVTSIGNSAFKDCTGLTSVAIGNSVTTIGSSAFSGCSNLETVVFGEKVQDIGRNAFYGCQNIYEMTMKAAKVPNVVAEVEGRSDFGTFQGVSKLAELHVPAESVKKYKIHPVWGLFDVITAIPCVVTLHCDNVMGAVTGAGSYQANEQVNISANPNLGYRFRQWSDGITTNPRTLVVVGDTTLTAKFEEIPASEYTVSVVVDAEQNGAVQMTLTAVPDAGYQFAQWSDGNTDNPRTILVTENMTLSATFSVATNVAATPTHGDTTGTRKVIRNGHVLIQRDGKTYTIMGQDISKSTPSRPRAYGDPATR